MLSHVLVPLDGSELAKSALDHALNLLGVDGRITLIMVLEPQEVALSEFYPSTILPMSNEKDTSTYTIIARNQAYLKRIASSIEETSPYKVDTLAEIGNPAARIADFAESLKVDAIIMSTHGRSGISRWLYGSVTQKVLAVAPCPVFVIPAKHLEDIHSRETMNSHSV